MIKYKKSNHYFLTNKKERKMEKENKKIVLNVLYAIVLFFAIMGVANLILNAVQLKSFVPSQYEGSYTDIYSKDFYKYTGQICLIAAIFAVCGLALFAAAFFIRKKKIFNLSFIVLEALVIIGILIIMITCGNKLSVKTYSGAVNSVYIYDFDLYSSTLSLYIQQFVTFILLLGVQIYQLFDKKASVKTNNN